MDNIPSTQRQYGLRQLALALGWPAGQVVVIDDDLGRSGASAEGRDGFQRRSDRSTTSFVRQRQKYLVAG